MEQSPSYKANSSSASQDIPYIYRTQRFITISKEESAAIATTAPLT